MLPDVVFLACHKIRHLLVGWVWDHGGTDVLRIISTRTKILDAHWGLWHEALGYDPRHIETPDQIYIDPEERTALIEEVNNDGAARRLARLHRPTRGPLTMDIFMLQRGDTYFSFIKILPPDPSKNK